MLKATHKTGLVFFPAFDWAIDPTHPEREERLLYTQDQIAEEGLFDIDGIAEFKPDLATVRDIQRVHFCVPDVMGVTTENHLISAGGAKTVGMAVMDRAVERGFALVRPPGHHAMRLVHGARGFCNINVEAVMIETLRQAYGVRRVAIVDTDCHHGDGTQDIYWHDPDTLFISLHQDGRTLYPGSGFEGELGGPNAAGATLNVPLPPRTAKEGFLYVVRNLVLPVLAEFEPELVINSAGQDNHYSDPLTQMNFCARGYAEMTSLLRPDIAVLEGGYSIEGALPYVNLGIILALAGLDYSRVREPDYDSGRLRQSAGVTAAIEKTVETLLACWAQRRQIRDRMRNDERFERRRRRIFYDTDNIVETQRETVRFCESCGGAVCIDSSSDRPRRVLAVQIPRAACPECRREALHWYESADRQTYDHVFLQDRPRDRFSERGRQTKADERI
jgi:acetoin utilization deacetylase AcuC-like enzyme